MLVINYCQNITITASWSGISSWVKPVEGAPQLMFVNVLNDLVILKLQTGIFWPGENVNTIGVWNMLDGYSIKVSNEISLTIAGSRSNSSTLQLSSGWNLILVLSSCDVDVETLFQGSDVVMVKEVAGWNIYWPVLNINNLGNLLTGRAYFVLMNSAGEITFPECSSTASSGAANDGPTRNELFRSTTWGSFSQIPNTYIIGLPVEAIDVSINKPGDILGVFDQNGSCCGASLWDDENTTLTVFRNYQLTPGKDGFVEDQDLNFKVLISTT
ncbi:MAG: hypothetical protein GY752_02265 [bacterium]|nr:hypothetical protein [bacterium]